MQSADAVARKGKRFWMTKGNVSLIMASNKRTLQILAITIHANDNWPQWRYAVGRHLHSPAPLPSSRVEVGGNRVNPALLSSRYIL
jgi:hypothetical protein